MSDNREIGDSFLNRGIERFSVTISGEVLEESLHGGFGSTGNEGLTSTGSRKVFDDSYVGAVLPCISCSILSRAGPFLRGCVLLQGFRSRPHQSGRVGFLLWLLWDRLWSLPPRAAQRRSSCERVSGESVGASGLADLSPYALHRNHVQELASLSICEHVLRAREIT